MRLRLSPLLSCLVLGGFEYFAVTLAPWLRVVGRVADGSIVWIGIFGWDSVRGIVVRGVVVVGRWLSHGG